MTAETALVVRFPKARKRGAKVRTEPLADIVAFPSVLSGDELHARWAWMHDHWDRWDHEDQEGSYSDREDWVRKVRIHQTLRSERGEVVTDAVMRRQIAEWRERIAKRTAMKDWLEALGVDWDKVRSPEDALAFVYDYLRASKPKSA